MSIPTQTSIVNLIMSQIVSALTAELVFVTDPDIKPEDEAVAGLVRAGKLQDDPTITQINILVHPALEDWPNQLDDGDATYEIGKRIPPFHWRARFNVDFKLYFDQELEREVAQVKAQVVLSRAHYALMKINAHIRDIPRDSFGGRAINMEVNSSYLRESGGVSEFIWRGRMRAQSLIHYQMPETP